MNRIDILQARTPATFVEMPVHRRQFWTARRLAEAFGIIDTVLLVAAGILANFIRFGSPDVSGVRGITLILAALLAWMVFRQMKLHDPATLGSAAGQLRRAATALFIVLSAMLAIGYATQTSETISRIWVVIWFACAFSAVSISRLTVAHIYRQRQAAGRYRRRLASCS